ncbi:hypothetical protein SAMN05421869_106109 [Nonomuraea jiangxiensis]|uniref:Uncharacterized protein n=1 Tax=Nonomuraea jiangxiensis TaxID=633440 RepID=A0A1G8LJ72_9ACTN|nr:hypothetical protein SAMN05421869_106109 [Nonomuraea jiangxiensis]
MMERRDRRAVLADAAIGVGASIAPLPGTQESRDELHQSIRLLLEAMIHQAGSVIQVFERPGPATAP